MPGKRDFLSHTLSPRSIGRFRWFRIPLVAAAIGAVALVAFTVLPGHTSRTSASSHRAFDQFDADAVGRNWTNEYLLAYLSLFVYEDEIPGAHGSDFEDEFVDYFEPLGLSNIHYFDEPFSLTENWSDTQVVTAETDDAIIVTFRGTQQLAPDVFTDVAFPTTPDGVHAGFAVAADSVYSDVKAAIAAAPGKKVWITGHSLGGALAQVTAYRLAVDRILDPSSVPAVQGVVTYGGPRVFIGGSISYAIYTGTYDDNHSKRWVNNLDPVPHVPLVEMGFLHTNPWTMIDVALDGSCSFDVRPTQLIFGDVFEHFPVYYVIRLFSLMPESLRVGLPLPKVPDDIKADCDVIPNVPPADVEDSNNSTNSVVEAAANGTAVGITASAFDANGDALTYSLTDDAGGRFAIDSSTGIVTVADGSLLDYESATSHSITVQASDGSAYPSSATFSINVSDVPPSTPTDTNAAVNQVDEGAANGTPVGITASSADLNGPAVSYSLTDDAGGRFAVNAASGVVTVADGSLIDYETSTSHNITVRASAGTGTSTTTFTIAVNNVAPSTPSDANTGTNTVAEGAAAGTAVGVTASSTDPNGPAVSYSLTSDAGGRFAINSASGVVSVVDGSLLDGPASHDITVTASDGTATSATATFTIAVTNVNPTASVDTLDGGLPNAGLVGVPVDFTGSFTDAAALDTHTASIDWGDGSTAGDFGGGEVSSPVHATHTYSSGGDYTVSFTVTDDDGGSHTATAQITIYDPAGATSAVLDEIDTRLSSETDPAVLAALQLARDELDGNQGGTEDNGALDKLESGDLVAALVKLQGAIADLSEAEAAGGQDASDLKLLLSLAAQSVAQGAYGDAVAALGPDPSKGQQKQLGKIAASVDEGIAELAVADYEAALDDFISAVQSAVDLVR